MKRVFLLIILSTMLAGCTLLVSPKNDPIRGDISKLKKKTSTLEKELTAIRKELDASRKEVRTLAARLSAEMDTLREEMAEVRGLAEEKQYNIVRVKENTEFLASSIQSMDERLKTIEEALKKDRAEEPAIDKLSTELEELRTAVKELEEKLQNIAAKGVPAAKKEPEKPNPGELYMEGLNLVREKKDYDEGLKVLRQFLSLYPNHRLSDNAQYWIGEIYYARGDWEGAIVEFNKVIKNYPKGDKVPAALLKQAYSFEKLGAIKEAKILLKKIIDEHPDSQESELAKKHLKKLK